MLRSYLKVTITGVGRTEKCYIELGNFIFPFTAEECKSDS